MSSTGYDCYLDKCLLPVTPEKLQLKISNSNKTITLIDQSMVNILKSPGLTDVEFECLLPQVQYPFSHYKNGFQSAEYFLNYFETLKTSKKPFQYIVSRAFPAGKTLFSTNLKVSMEEYTITEDVKYGFDVMVKVKLKQWKDYGTKNITLKAPEPKEETPAATPVATVPEQAPVATPEPVRAESTVQEEPIGIGDDVIVNGQLHASSYGNGPGMTLTNYQGKINFINTKGSHPYHVTQPNGGWLGWVLESAVKKAV